MRPIDAEPIEQELFKRADKSLAKNPYENAKICAFRRAFELVLNAPTITPLLNDPLTLEELLEMDGEPVWVETFVKGLKSHWAIVYGEYLSDGRFTDDKERCLLSIDEIGGYGLAYVAYRRKKEDA